MAKRERVDKTNRKGDTPVPVPRTRDLMSTNLDDHLAPIDEAKAKRSEALRVFWDEYFNSLEDARREIEQRAKRSVRWARETLIR
jgi:hypothetical protein